jgi:uncharacterized protein (DUF58 family)
MISPRPLLLLLATFVVLPALTVIVAAPAFVAPAAVVLTCCIFAVAIDAVLLQPDLSGLRVALPPITRLSKGRSGELVIKCLNESSRALSFRLGLPIPASIKAQTNEFEIDLNSRGGQALLIPCRPAERGQFFLEKSYAQATTRWRFWNVRRELASSGEFRVYPDLLSERRNVSALFLRRGLFGFRQHRQVGKGREFEKLREYIPGDSVEDVHWKATAKRRHPVTKVFQIERTQEVYVMVDASRLSARWSGGMPTLERYINSALLLCLAAARQSDLFGLVTFSDKVHRFIRARNGKAHYDVCRDALYTLETQLVTPAFEDLFTFLRLNLRRRALLVFLTALDDPVLGENFVQSVDLLTRQHLVLVNTVQPAEAHPLFAANDVHAVDDVYRRLGGHLVWAELQEIGKRLQRCGVEFSPITSDRFAAETVNRYFRVKQRQIL